VIEYRQALKDDLPAIAEVFWAAFGKSIRHVGVGPAAKRAIADAFGLAFAADPCGLAVAVSQGRVLGYVLSTPDARRLRTKVLWQGGWLRFAWRLLRGHYGINWRAMRVVMSDKLAFLRGARHYGACQARVLSLAVHPDAQGQGAGRALFAAGLDYLRAAGADSIRLEVRPGNVPARRIYESFGFRAQGNYADGQGKWLVMTKHMREESPCCDEYGPDCPPPV
jgi:ribosomal protein S18 acetylase RimI-like enzyme